MGMNVSETVHTSVRRDGSVYYIVLALSPRYPPLWRIFGYLMHGVVLLHMWSDFQNGILWLNGSMELGHHAWRAHDEWVSSTLLVDFRTVRL